MRRAHYQLTALLGVLSLLILSTQRIEGQGNARFNREIVNGREAVAGEALVRFRDPLQAGDLAEITRAVAADDVRRVGRAGAMVVRSRVQSTVALLARLRNRPEVEYAEPNFIIRIAAQPNDPSFGQLWGLQNIGQIINFFPGIPGADIDAVAAWDLSVGTPDHVVAVIDTGIDYTHPDLAANMWSAPAAFTVTVAGQPVTCAAGTHGFNVITRSCDPMDDHHHGTHVAGTIGAVGDNGIGVAGVNWTTRMIGIKFIDDTGSGTTADAIAAIEFAVAVKQAFAAGGTADVRVLSNSWGGPEFSQAMLDEVILADAADMLFVAGAGNDGLDNDVLPMYPASFNAPNVISVAATSNTDDMAWFSNYGAASVHLGAPGVDILSTVPGGSYAFLSGTSMATPHVSGAAALVLSACEMDTASLKATLLGTVAPVAGLAGLTVTGGRLQVNSALHACTLPPETPTNLTARPGDTEIALAWAAALGATKYNVKRSLTAGGPYVTIAPETGDAAYVDHDVVNGTRYYYVVSGQNTLGESGDSNEVSAVPNIPPDVVVSALAGPGVAGAGTTIEVSVTTTNQGTGNADPSTTRFYLSGNSVFDAADLPIEGAQVVPALAAGASSTATVSIEIPAGTATGRNYVIAYADADDVLFESSETNNARSRSVQVGPDLDVSAFIVPSTAGSGATIAVTDTVTNAGGSAAPATVTSFYLSTNSSLGAGDVLLGSRAVPALGAAAVTTGSADLTIPATTISGSYYVIAKADGNDAIIEISETNNTYSRSIKIGADLIISALTVSNSASGSSLVASDTTTNAGAGTAGASVTRFYLSSNSSFDATDTRLDGARPVPPLDSGASSSGETMLTVPGATPAGSYYLIARADTDSGVLETSETNNTLARLVSIGSDLIVSSFVVPLKGGAGAAISVTDTTTNGGSAASAPSTTRFYLSANSTWDTADVLVNGGHAVSTLDAGVGDTASTALTIPAATGTGTYYLIARADGDNAVAEAKETNNTLARAVAIGPDLDVSSLTVPAKGGAGLVLAVSDVIVNLGGGSAGGTMTRFYLSTNSSLDATDTLVGGRSTAGLAPTETSSASTTLTIPVGTASGTYYVIVKSDADGAVTETSETNNTFVRSVRIGPDLSVASLTASATTVAAGAAVTVTDKTANDGGGAAGASVTRFYLSVNALLDAADVVLAAGRGVPAVAAATSSTGSTPVTIPAGTAAGRYYILAKADGDGVVAETSETDNVLSRSIQVTAP